MKAWGLRYLWTLTYEVARTDWAAVVYDLRRFFIRLARTIGKVPIAVVIERGRRGTKRLHVHLAVDRWLPHKVMERIWGEGFVWVGDPGKYPPVTSASQLAGYLSKYMAKQMEDEANGDGDRPEGARRWHHTNVAKHDVIRARAPTLDAALAWLQHSYGSPEVAVAFGIWDPGHVFGVWLNYPAWPMDDPPPRE